MSPESAAMLEAQLSRIADALESLELTIRLGGHDRAAGCPREHDTPRTGR